MQKNIRIMDETNINYKSLQEEIDNGNIVTIQYSKEIYDRKILNEINKFCSKNNDSFSVRFFGHYGSSFNCSFLQYLPSVKSLYLDCLQSVTNFIELKNIDQLVRLNIGIYDFSEKDFLAWDNLHQVSHLFVTESKNNNINLEYLENYKNLKTLFINGHIKNIGSIAKCSKITDLSLCIPSKAQIKFINNLTNLKKLRLILGGRENLDEISENNIEELEIIRVKGFNSFSNLRNFRQLRRLQIEDQIQLSELHFQGTFDYLEDIKLLNCKTLTNVTGLENAKNLYQLRIYKTNIDFEKFISNTFSKSLKILAFYTTKKKIDDVIYKKLTSLGYKNGLER